MNKQYQSKKLEKFYENRKDFRKKLGQFVAEGLEELLDAIDAASNAYDLMVIPYFKMHHLYGNLYGIYSLSVDNKKSKWRMLIKCLNENDEWVKPGNNEKQFLIDTKKIEIGEFTDHYD